MLGLLDSTWNGWLLPGSSGSGGGTIQTVEATTTCKAMEEAANEGHSHTCYTAGLPPILEALWEVTAQPGTLGLGCLRLGKAVGSLLPTGQAEVRCANLGHLLRLSWFFLPICHYRNPELLGSSVQKMAEFLTAWIPG